MYGLAIRPLSGKIPPVSSGWHYGARLTVAQFSSAPPPAQYPRHPDRGRRRGWWVKETIMSRAAVADLEELRATGLQALHR